MKKFALVGCGQVAAQHAANIARVGKLLAVCDIVKERADAFAATYHARAYNSIDELLANEKEVEVISVCTPNGFHAEHSIKSLQAKKHVVCEKPLCLTTAAAWQIIETEKFCRRKLFVVKSSRYNPVLQAVQKAIADGQLGQVYSFHLSCLWHRPNEYYTDWKGKLFPDGGTLYTQFSHSIDAMLWLFGGVAQAKGFKQNAAHQNTIEFEDTGTVALQMQNGALGTLHWSVNAFRKNHEIALTILTEKGTIRIGGEDLNEVLYAETEASLLLPTTVKEANDTSSADSDKSYLRDVYDHLMQVLDSSEKSYAGAFEGLQTIETIEKIYKATA